MNPTTAITAPREAASLTNQEWAIRCAREAVSWLRGGNIHYARASLKSALQALEKNDD